MLSIVIVNWNTRDLLLACLRSIPSFPPSGPYEVIVVDNASTDGSAEAVRTEHPGVHLIANERNLGYAAANNQGFAAASGEWILTLNPDTELSDDSLDNAIAKLQAHPECAALGARQIGPDDRTQRSVRGFPSFRGILGDLTGLGRLLPHTSLGSYRLPAFNYEKEQPAPQPMGTFLLFRRSGVESLTSAPLAGTNHPESGEGVLRPFDESFPIFFNEVDLLYRLKQAGYGCLYSPDVQIRHLGGESTKQVRKSMVWESHRSLVRFFKKHYQTPWNAPGILLLSGLIYLGAFIRAKGYDAGFRA